MEIKVIKYLLCRSIAIPNFRTSFNFCGPKGDRMRMIEGGRPLKTKGVAKKVDWAFKHSIFC